MGSQTQFSITTTGQIGSINFMYGILWIAKYNASIHADADADADKLRILLCL